MSDLRESIVELIAIMSEMGETGLYVVVSMDPETRNYEVHGLPVKGPEAVVRADRMRREFDSTDLANVEVHVAQYQKWNPTDAEG